MSETWRGWLGRIGAVSLWLSLLWGCAHAPASRTAGAAGAPRGVSTTVEVRPEPYLRRVEGTNGIVGLEVAVRRFATTGRSRSPVEVWLVGVTHLGTSNYYARIQRFLDSQDLVLFEGIGATNRDFHFSEARGFALQPALAKALGLRFQLASMDYQRTNWFNSDLDLGALEKELSAGNKAANLEQVKALLQGEGAVGGIARLGVAILGASTRLQVLAKLMLIETLSSFSGELPEGLDFGVNTRELMRVLIEKRNSVVVRDLELALGRSPAPRSVAVFYGAGHMPDLELQVRQKLGLVPVEDQWLRAFSVNPARAGLDRADLDALRESIQRQFTQ